MQSGLVFDNAGLLGDGRWGPVSVDLRLISRLLSEMCLRLF